MKAKKATVSAGTRLVARQNNVSVADARVLFCRVAEDIDRAIDRERRKAAWAERERCVEIVSKYALGSDCDREIWACRQCIDAMWEAKA